MLVNVNDSTELFRGDFPIRFEDLLVGDEAHVEGLLEGTHENPYIQAELVIVTAIGQSEGPETPR